MHGVLYNITFIACPITPNSHRRTPYAPSQERTHSEHASVDAYKQQQVYTRNRYIYTSTVDGFNINYPIILTPKEY